MIRKMYHRPVLLQESVEGLAIIEDGIYVDVTFGGGGHSKEILGRLGSKGKLFAFDQDEEALQNALDDERFTLINENFRYIRQFLKFYGITGVNGILADLGVSSHQFDTAGRGFSTRLDGTLDMRMSQRNELTARDVVNSYTLEDLTRILFEFSDLRNARAIAKRLVEVRVGAEVKTTADLKEALRGFLPEHRKNKVLAQIYQAIRIEVNQELQILREFLQQVPEILVKNGRLSVISYHSLEDRLVKRFIRAGKFEGEAEKDFYGNPQVPMKKVGKLIVPTEVEIGENNRARSAKLRIAEKI
ncbi:MAG: 16S rRNA (cytosine(1402)-N(4))-methyltransferase RsmH [Flavobacteriaceae bacterium]